MQNYQSEYEKQIIAEKFAKQLKIMTICRIVMPLTMLALLGGIVKARGVWVDILFGTVIAVAIALMVILLLGFRLNFCPFCGKDCPILPENSVCFLKPAVIAAKS